MNIGILCPSEIAYRRFLPALNAIDNATLVGVGVNTPEERYGDKVPDQHTIDSMLQEEKTKALKMIDEYGGRLFDSYQAIISIFRLSGERHRWGHENRGAFALFTILNS